MRWMVLFPIVLVVTVRMTVTSRNLNKPAVDHNPFYLLWWESQAKMGCLLEFGGIMRDLSLREAPR